MRIVNEYSPLQVSSKSKELLDEERSRLATLEIYNELDSLCKIQFP